MTAQSARILHCDFPDCPRRTEALEVNAPTPDGWTDAIHTHGCPDHGELIAAHKATVTDVERHRKTYWSLRCACGWTPGLSEPYSSRSLKVMHRVHVAEVGRQKCCDLHGHNCEQGGEECCRACTEAHHFEPDHGGVPCSSPNLSLNGDPR